MDETPRLEHALGWLAEALAQGGPSPGQTELHEAYLAACRQPDPGEPSLLVQMLRSLAVTAEATPALRRRVPWDGVPLDPYPEAIAALRQLRDAGFRLGVLANQPASTEGELERAGIANLCDGVWLSGAVGMAKPDPAFFRLALEAWGLEPRRIAYVGDRPDNDVAPAKALGMMALRLRRGPHAWQLSRSESERADLEAPDLAEAASLLVAWRASLAVPAPYRGPEPAPAPAEE
jgi:HAD superfamily hydrolase (TIGR01509 family)